MVEYDITDWQIDYSVLLKKLKKTKLPVMSLFQNGDTFEKTIVINSFSPEIILDSFYSEVMKG
ncbi:MAG: hypothetical protein KDH96_04440 [Candidatus Riesia sp.]|nr:hypothetical protein [Candidatus Riesia sp.]